MSGGNFGELEERVQQLKSRMDSLAKIATAVDEENEQLRAEIDELRRENQVIRRKLEQVEEDTSMLGDIRQGNATDRERRMAVIMLTLRNEAARNGGKAALDAGDCHSALNKEPDRTTMYGLMEDTADLVESDCVRFVRESRSSKRNTRIEMDTAEGPVPTTVGGYDVTGEEVA